MRRFRSNVLDPFAPFKLVLMALPFWLRLLGPKKLAGITAFATLAVLIAGCHETYT